MAKQRMRQSRQERDDVAAMVAKRDQLDRDQQQQRQREESAFARYARAQLRLGEVERERDDTVADLDRRREQVVTDAHEQLDAIAAEQSAVLVELHGDGRGRRSADDLAALFDLPVKRVRAMLKRARSAAPSGRGSESAAPETPARPAGGDTGAATPAPAGPRDSTHVPVPPAEHASAAVDADRAPEGTAVSVVGEPASPPGGD
ncbi:translation initiation factor IF-2 [Pseudonocardia sp. EC080610-09]|uniref:translation initiation factor IF-2 n=1 Tax=Pseudonocardia sp. EC080610-09 TaxID=1688404 RepID=UPI0011AE9986|nr:translation initiation factor IF-2 [Pseudonocardia sp. EC080610-09]